MYGTGYCSKCITRCYPYISYYILYIMVWYTDIGYKDILYCICAQYTTLLLQDIVHGGVLMYIVQIGEPFGGYRSVYTHPHQDYHVLLYSTPIHYRLDQQSIQYIVVDENKCSLCSVHHIIPLISYFLFLISYFLFPAMSYSCIYCKHLLM